MDAGFGGPVWHASVHHRHMGYIDEIAFKAQAALHRLGDSALGEWTERSPDLCTAHVRRRLTHAEWGEQPWGHDLRGTNDGQARLIAAGVTEHIGRLVGEW